MATAVSVKPREQAINGQAAIALALLSAWQEKRNDRGGGPTLEDVSSRIAELLNDHIEIYDLGLRRVPGGVYSDEVETFVGHLLAEGLATHRSPLKITAQGEKLLRMIVRVESEDHDQAVRLAAKVLALDPQEIL
jgi:hypothetical protein